MTPDDILGDVGGIVQLEGEILCHVEHQGAYTDVGTEEELCLIGELAERPWREVVQERYAATAAWLYRIITDDSRSRMLTVLNPPAGGRFLDVGSGWGQVTIPLARRGETHALDLTLNRLRILREIARQEGVQPRLHCGNLLTYPFRDNLFDLVILNGVLEYLGLGRTEGDWRSQQEALRRVRSLLTTTGRAYVGIENAIGLKYLLGAPDDHTGRGHFTFLLDRTDGTEARTWALDQYLKLFFEAGLEPEQVYACFPDYKLIQHLVPLSAVDQFLLEKGLPAREHSGADGAPLGMDEALRSLYQTLARLGISRHFVPSFGFVLRRRARPAVLINGRPETIERAVSEVLPGEDRDRFRLTPTLPRVSYTEACQTRRYFIQEGNRPVASVKQVPLTSLFNAEAILAVYAEYGKARTFRPVRLLKSWKDEESLWLVEEYVPEAVTLDDLVRDCRLTPDEATERIVTMADDIWELSAEVNLALLQRQLDECESFFLELFEDRTAALIFYRSFREMIWQVRDRLRTVLTTRDYIGRNILQSADREWVLIDYDLATRSTLFPVDLARNFIQVPYCTERLLRARAFAELDSLLIKIAATAAECALQRQVLPPDRHEAIIGLYRSHLLGLLSPQQMRSAETHRANLDLEIEKARVYQANLEGQLQALRGELAEAARYQANLEGQLQALRGELAEAARYQANLEGQIATLRRPRVDVMVVNYNGRRWIDGFLESLEQASYPADRLRLIFVDNGSTDGSLEYARERAARLGFPTVFVPTGRNLGFTGGYEQAFHCGDAEYYFVINTDTRMATDAIPRLVEVLSADPRVGLAEARQSPREHPKYYDSVTGETSWCSGACVMVREKALRSVGGGFDPTFFMYAEDVDLSWRMWLHGWKCVYVPDAVVEHFTEDLDPQRDHSIQHYYSMRNGAVMRVLYGTWFEAVLHYAAMLRVGTLSRNPWWHKRLTLKAAMASLWHLPHALRKRRSLRRLGRSPWVFFNGWLYGRHARDPAAEEAGVPVADLLSLWPAVRRTLGHDLPIDQHIVSIPVVYVGGVRRRAALVFDSGRLEYDLTVPPGAVLAGAIAVPEEAWKDSAVGRFEVLQDGQPVWQSELDLGSLAKRQWVPFEAVLAPTPIGRRSRITLAFHGQRDLVWGLWGEPQLCRRLAQPQTAQKGGGLATGPATGPVISVVIPTHNRADSLPRTIHRLMAQDVPKERFEVILVDSNSVDATPEAAARLAREYPNLRTLRCDRPGAAAARNLGLESAVGSLVVLIDDDILVRRDFVRQVLKAAEVHPGRVLLGRILTCWEGSCNPFHRYLLQVQDVNIYDFPDPADVPPNYFYTACVAIPREVLGTLRFDEGFRVYGVEDIEFGFRLLAGGTRMVYLPELQVLHDYHPTYRVYRRKKHKAGYSLGYFLSEHPEHAERFQFGLRFRRFYHLWRALRTLGAPVAGLLYLWERLLYHDGPINRWLHRWWYADLRIQLYSGLKRFRRGASPP